MAKTLDDLPPEARQRADALKRQLPADWRVSDISSAPDELGVSYLLHFVDAAGQPVSALQIYVPAGAGA